MDPSSWETRVRPAHPAPSGPGGQGGAGKRPRVEAGGQGAWSLVLDHIAEPALSPEQLAAGLVVGDPVPQVLRQLGGLHLQGERVTFPQAPRPGDEQGCREGCPARALPSQLGPLLPLFPLERVPLLPFQAPLPGAPSAVHPPSPGLAPPSRATPER